MKWDFKRFRLPKARECFEFLRRRRAIIFVAVASLLVFLFHGAGLNQSIFFRDMDADALSLRFSYRGPTKPHPDIVMLSVGDWELHAQRDKIIGEPEFAYEPTLQHMTQTWPWDKALFARALEKLGEAGAALVLFDFVFVTASEGDFVFSEVNERFRSKVVLASYFQTSGDVTAQEGVRVAFYEPHDDILPWPAEDVEEDNYEDMIGFANVNFDADDVVRRSYYRENRIALRYEASPAALLDATQRLNQEEGKSMSPKQVLRRFREQPDYQSFSAVAASKLLEGTVRFPPMERSNFINYAGPARTYTPIPFLDIFLKDRWEADLLSHGAYFKDKIVLIGPYSETQWKDWHPTPYDVMPGPEIQANQLANLLLDNHIREWPFWGEILLTFVLTALTVVIALRYQHVLSKLGGMILLGVLFLALSQFCFESLELFLPVSGAFVGIFVFGNFAVAYDFLLEQYERLRVRGMFGTYVSPEVVNEMIESGEEPKLGGVEEEITCFFSDIQSFSSFSEVLTPKQLVDIMNEYLTDMTDILHQHNGTLDKYIGDAIVAMYGAPIRIEAHAHSACVSAHRMQIRQAELRQKWKSEEGKWPDLCHRMRTRIGLNTGMVTVGNMGSATRFNYTMMGDNVNLAARLESGAKSYGVYTMVSESTRRAAMKEKGDDLIFRYLDKIVVKGRTKPVEVYELMGVWGELENGVIETLECWELAMKHFLNRRWDIALKHFNRALQYEPYHPDRAPGSPTTPSNILIERVHHYKENEPPEDWDGTWVMTSK